MNDDKYVYLIDQQDGPYSRRWAEDLLALPGYAHAFELLRRGAIPVAQTIDGHFILSCEGKTWIVDAPRSGGAVEELIRDWREVVRAVEANEPISSVIGWDESDT
jgi:hypothetical protein